MCRKSVTVLKELHIKSYDKHQNLTHDFQLHTSDRVIPPTINTKIRVPVMVGSVLAILRVESLTKFYSEEMNLCQTQTMEFGRILTSIDFYSNK